MLSAADSPTHPSAGAPAGEPAVQRITLVRREYNNWVASETKEDYALRFTPQRFRKWSEWRVSNTAFGAASFLILEAVGAGGIRFFLRMAAPESVDQGREEE
jgi:hypothetical protein